MPPEFDLAIVGSGFAGSLMSMIARRLGRSVLLLERGQHPRFVIGESSTPLANLLLDELAHRYQLPRIFPLTKWGTWQQAHPEIGCGLKRGFTFFHHSLDHFFEPDPGHNRQLLVGASPEDRIADTHWYRPDFDRFLVDEAVNLGVEYLDRTALTHLQTGPHDVMLEGERLGKRLKWRARLVIDASGPRGFTHRMLGLAEAPLPHLPATQGLFTHFRGVRRLDEMGLVGEGESPPYPIDDAAVHHVFDGGWIWVLRFNNGLTSAGVAAKESLANELRLAEGEPAWHRLLERLPTVREQFRDSRIERPFIHAPRLGFRSAILTGPRWVQLPYAAGFIDPLLSTGFTLSLLGIDRLAQAIERDWESDALAGSLERYALETDQDLLAAERLVAALYSSLGDFSVFAKLSLLYFAAVSYAETARRMGRPELAPSFLLAKDPRFGPRSRALCERVLTAMDSRGLTLTEKAEFFRAIDEAIQPIDVAGLCDPSRHHWFPAQAEDLIAAAPKLDATAAEMRTFLIRCGFLAPNGGSPTDSAPSSFPSRA